MVLAFFKITMLDVLALALIDTVLCCAVYLRAPLKVVHIANKLNCPSPTSYTSTILFVYYAMGSNTDFNLIISSKRTFDDYKYWITK